MWLHGVRSRMTGRVESISGESLGKAPQKRLDVCQARERAGIWLGNKGGEGLSRAQGQGRPLSGCGS